MRHKTRKNPKLVCFQLSWQSAKISRQHRSTPEVLNRVPVRPKTDIEPRDSCYYLSVLGGCRPNFKRGVNTMKMSAVSSSRSKSGRVNPFVFYPVAALVLIGIWALIVFTGWAVTQG
jgi:hypothetical protein